MLSLIQKGCNISLIEHYKEAAGVPFPVYRITIFGHGCVKVVEIYASFIADYIEVPAVQKGTPQQFVFCIFDHGKTMALGIFICLY